MAIKLITGLKEVEDIQSEDDGARVYSTFSNADRVLEVGEKFEYQIISNNCIRIKSGEALMQGRHVRQAPNTYTDLNIDNGSQDLNRNDLIVLRYTKDQSNGIENAELVVIKGTPSSSASDPTVTTGDIYSGCNVHEMKLYRVSIEGLNISSVTALFSTIKRFEGHTHSLNDIDSGTFPISRGGTGATTASEALKNLGGAPYEEKIGVDFNEMKTPGIYMMESSPKNAPTSGSYHSLIVHKSDSSCYQQTAIKEGTTEMYIRYGSGSTWQAWEKVGVTAEYTATLSTSWTGSSAPYSQNVTVTGIKSSDNPIVDVVLSSTTSTAKNQLEAWGCVSRITTSSNQITAYCLEDKPTTSIPIRLRVVR